MSDKNLALLTQEEIDTLIGIINEKRIRIGAQVLSQDKIDTLIEQLRKTECTKDVDSKGIDAALETAAIKERELMISVNNENSYLEIYVIDKYGKRVNITPNCLETESIINDDSRWGRAIEPHLFDKIASVFELTYTEEIFVKVCRYFSEVMYGDSSCKIENIYLPTKSDMMSNMK